MRKLFIHQPFFRIISPICNGIIVYLLILLVHNNVMQITEQFLGEELYVCILLSYIIQEFSRGMLLLFDKVKTIDNYVGFIFVQLVVSILICIGLVTSLITIYYKFYLGFSPEYEELLMFNSIFCSITLLYDVLFISHQYLHRINSKKLRDELRLKHHLELDFEDFKHDINPDLLLESLESLIVVIQEDYRKSDDFIDYLSTIYRYVLIQRDRQLVSITEEINIVRTLIQLCNELPYRNTTLVNEVKEGFFVVPGSLLFIIEEIIRTTINSLAVELKLVLKEEENRYQVSYKKNDKLTTVFNANNFEAIQRAYKTYSLEDLKIIETNDTRTITIPKLTFIS